MDLKEALTIIPATGYLGTMFEGRKMHLEKRKLCFFPFSLILSHYTLKRPRVYTILRASGCRVGEMLPDQLNTQEKRPLKSTEKASIQESRIRERLLFFEQNVY